TPVQPARQTGNAKRRAARAQSGVLRFELPFVPGSSPGQALGLGALRRSQRMAPATSTSRPDRRYAQRERIPESFNPALLAIKNARVRGSAAAPCRRGATSIPV